MDGPGDSHSGWSNPEAERRISYETTFVWNLQNDVNELTKQKETQTERMNLHLLEGRMGRRDRQGVWNGHLHTAIFKMDNQQRECMYSCWREEWREGIERVFGMGMYFPLFLKWIANKDLLCSTWNFAQCYVAAWRERSLGGEWMHMCVCVCVCVCVWVWLSPFAVHLELSQHCLLISCAPEQK